MRAYLLLVFVLVFVALAACGVKGPPRPPVEPRGAVKTSTAAVVQPRPEHAMIGAEPMAKSIGTAKMKPDGTIVLMLRAEDGKGAVGDALFEYPPAHPSYKSVL